MDPAEARTVLCVAADASDDEVRAAFRRLLLDHHPDRTGGGDGEATRVLIEAYRTLAAGGPEPLAQLDLFDVTADFELELPADEAFLAVLDAAHAIGDVTYVDAEAGLLEVVRTHADGTRTSLLLTLQGRAAAGTTEVFVTEEPLG
jgi:hypothetical protein